MQWQHCFLLVLYEFWLGMHGVLLNVFSSGMLLMFLRARLEPRPANGVIHVFNPVCYYVKSIILIKNGWHIFFKKVEATLLFQLTLTLQDWKHKDVDLLLSNLQTSKPLSRKPYHWAIPKNIQTIPQMAFWNSEASGGFFELKIWRHGGGDTYICTTGIQKVSLLGETSASRESEGMEGF